ncbi:MAG: amino acid ABC transporter substrate-binding protein [Proteobacteria bacterium]|nr:amino acid ABC transporter substrate-binding protein [Pseudomonadota bacterium]
MRTVAAALAALAMAFVTGVAGAQTPVAATGPIRVGAVLAQSGIAADYAAEYRKGLLLWLEAANATGGLLGRTLELQLLDDRSESAETEALYRKLIESSKVDLLIGPWGTAATLGAIGAAERTKRVLVNGGGAGRNLHRRARGWVKQVATPYSAWAEAAITAAREQGAKRVMVLARNDPVSREMGTHAVELAARSGLQAGTLEMFAPGTTAFAPFVDKARAAAVDAWIAFGQPIEAAEMVKTFKWLGYAPTLFIAQGVAAPAFVKQVGQDAEHAIGFAAYTPGLRTRGNAAFVSAFTAKFSAAPGLGAAQGYAAGQVLAEAVRKAGSLDQGALRAALDTLQTETPLGAYRIDSLTGAQLGARVALVQIQRGRPVAIWPPALAAGKARLPYPRWNERTLLDPRD